MSDHAEVVWRGPVECCCHGDNELRPFVAISRAQYDALKEALRVLQLSASWWARPNLVRASSDETMAIQLKAERDALEACRASGIEREGE